MKRETSLTKHEMLIEYFYFNVFFEKKGVNVSRVLIDEKAYTTHVFWWESEQECVSGILNYINKNKFIPGK